MIWILHYLIFNSGLSAVLILLTLFLQTYSKASMSEIGLLLMILPFLAVFIKPIFCALADRQRAHRYYLIGALIFMSLGYGSLIIVPCFFPDAIETHPNVVWYCDILSIVVGFSAFGLTWSIGDALSVEAARKRNIPWGTYRVWGTISWGVFGVIIGQINEVPILPKFVPAFLVLIFSGFLEALLMACWSKDAFEAPLVEAAVEADDDNQRQQQQVDLTPQLQQQQQHQSQVDVERGSAGSRGSIKRGLDRRLVASVLMEDISSTLKSSLRLQGARRRAGLDDILAQHGQQQQQASPPSTPTPLAGHALAGSRNGSVASRGKPAHSKPSPMIAAALANALAAKADTTASDSLAKSPADGSPEHLAQQQQHSSSSVSFGGAAGGSISRAASSLGRAALQRTRMALSRMDSLGAASGNAIADDLANDSQQQATTGAGANLPPHQQVLMMSSLASGASLTRAQAIRAMGFSAAAALADGSQEKSAAGRGALTADHICSGEEQSAAMINEHLVKDNEPRGQLHRTLSTTTQSIGRNKLEQNKDLQMVLLKLIIRRDSSIWKLLFVFTFFGALMTAHITYFFVHVADLCKQHDVTFSSVTGAMLASHSISEIFSFLVVVPYYVTRVGHIGSFATCGLIHAIRFFYYGTLYPAHSPYMGVVSEISHGIIYGVVYSLITDVANDCVNRVDQFLPELVERGLVEPDINPAELKLPLRATMQGVFSGAFDGLGNGIGALAGGIYLDHYSFRDLWTFCGCAAVAIALFYPLTEWRKLCAAGKGACGESCAVQQSPPGAGAGAGFAQNNNTNNNKHRLTKQAAVEMGPPFEHSIGGSQR